MKLQNWQRILFLVVGIVKLIDLAYGFFNEPESSSMFGYEVNIWFSRLFNAILAFGFLGFWYNSRERKS